MLPTMNVSGDFVLVSKQVTLKHGQVVLAISPLDPTRKICKRIIGLPGDKIHSHPHPIPPGHVWLQGDNLNNSVDSRSYGPVPIGLLKGTILCKVTFILKF